MKNLITTFALAFVYVAAGIALVGLESDFLAGVAASIMIAAAVALLFLQPEAIRNAK